MRKKVLALLVMTMTVTACGTVRDSRLNPFNWFGRSTSVPVQASESEVNPLIPRRNPILQSKAPEAYRGTLVQNVTELHIRRVPGGAVIEVTGVMRSAGSFDVRLTPEASESADTLVYAFRALQPRSSVGVGTAYSRTVSAAIRLTEQELAGIRTIQVKARENVRSSRR